MLTIDTQCVMGHAATYNVLIAIIQGGRVRYSTIHHPSLAFVLSPDEVLDFPIETNCQSTVEP